MKEIYLKVSVVMSVYNGEKYLREAIDSIISQTFKDFEFIIINDGSTDKTGEMLESYKDSRIVLINQENMGLTKSLNKGIDAARGEYIARMDADDVSLPERLEKQVEFMDNNPDVGVLGTGFQLIDMDGCKLERYRFPEENDFIVWSMFFYNPIVHPSVMMRKSVVDEVDGYDVELPQAQDYELWSRLYAVSSFANLQDVHLQLRKHESNITVNMLEGQTRSAVEACRCLIATRLGHKVPFEIVHALWTRQYKGSKEVAKVAYIIYKLCRSFLCRTTNAQSRDLIFKDATDKLLSLSRTHATGFYSMKILLLKCCLNICNMTHFTRNCVSILTRKGLLSLMGGA